MTGAADRSGHRSRAHPVLLRLRHRSACAAAVSASPRLCACVRPPMRTSVRAPHARIPRVHAFHASTRPREAFRLDVAPNVRHDQGCNEDRDASVDGQRCRHSPQIGPLVPRSFEATPPSAQRATPPQVAKRCLACFQQTQKGCRVRGCQTGMFAEGRKLVNTTEECGPDDSFSGSPQVVRQTLPALGSGQPPMASAWLESLSALAVDPLAPLLPLLPARSSSRRNAQFHASTHPSTHPAVLVASL